MESLKTSPHPKISLWPNPNGAPYSHLLGHHHHQQDDHHFYISQLSPSLILATVAATIITTLTVTIIATTFTATVISALPWRLYL